MLVFPLTAMATDDDSEYSNDGDNGDGGTDEAAIMDIANALIQTSSPPTTMIASDENNGIDGVDAIETFMQRANSAWTDGLSGGETASSMMDSEVFEAAAAAEEEAIAELEVLKMNMKSGTSEKKTEPNESGLKLLVKQVCHPTFIRPFMFLAFIFFMHEWSGMAFLAFGLVEVMKVRVYCLISKVQL